MTPPPLSDLESLLRDLRAVQRAAAMARWLNGRPRQRAAYRRKKQDAAERNWQRFGPVAGASGVFTDAGPPIPPGAIP